MKVKEENKKAGLKLNNQETRIMTSNPITSWQTEGEKVETVIDFIFLDSKITADTDSSHDIKRCLLGKKSNDRPRQCFKEERCHLLTMVHLVKAMVFLVVIV